MKLQDGPTFGAVLIGCGLAYFLFRSGKPLALSLLGGVGVVVADYVRIVWLKSKRIKQ